MEFLDGISCKNGNESSKIHQRYIHISIEDVPIKIRDSSSSDPDVTIKTCDFASDSWTCVDPINGGGSRK